VDRLRIVDVDASVALEGSSLVLLSEVLPVMSSVVDPFTGEVPADELPVSTVVSLIAGLVALVTSPVISVVAFSTKVDDSEIAKLLVVLRTSLPILEDASDVPLLSTVLANSVEAAVVFDGRPVSFAGVTISVVELNSSVDRLSAVAVAKDDSFAILETVERISVEVPFNSPVEVTLINSVEAPAMVVSISVDEPLTASVDEALTNSVEAPAMVVDISVDEPLIASIEVPLTNSVDAPAMVVANSVDEPLMASVEEPLINSVEIPAVVVNISVDEPLRASVEVPLISSVEAMVVNISVDDPLTASIDEPLINSVVTATVEISVEEPLIASIEVPLINSVEVPLIISVEVALFSANVDDSVVAFKTISVVALPNSVEAISIVETLLVVVKFCSDTPVTSSVDMPASVVAFSAMDVGAVPKLAEEGSASVVDSFDGGLPADELSIWIVVSLDIDVDPETVLISMVLFEPVDVSLLNSVVVGVEVMTDLPVQTATFSR